MANESELSLPNLGAQEVEYGANGTLDAPVSVKSAADLEQVFDVPVTVSAVLGNSRMAVGDLLKLAPGAVLELDRKVGEANRHLRQQPPRRAARWCSSTSALASP